MRKRWSSALKSGLLAVAVLAGTTLIARASVSPAPDMPAEWFWHDDAAQAKQHADLIGKPAPKIETSKWFQGEVKADDMKDKVVVIDLWATWCGPCRAAMPHTNEMAAKYKDQGVVVFSICSSGEQKDAEDFIKEAKLTLPMAWDKMNGDSGTTFTAFKGQWYPTYVLIDRKGTVRAIGLTSDHVEDALKKILAEK
ncbi:MAG: TlpA disulfide reductase family protein [Tepidisphaeraceae bacterium]